MNVLYFLGIGFALSRFEWWMLFPIACMSVLLWLSSRAYRQKIEDLNRYNDHLVERLRRAGQPELADRLAELRQPEVKWWATWTRL